MSQQVYFGCTIVVDHTQEACRRFGSCDPYYRIWPYYGDNKLSPDDNNIGYFGLPPQVQHIETVYDRNFLNLIGDLGGVGSSLLGAIVIFIALTFRGEERQGKPVKLLSTH
eukprot:TRINITY_DN1655_c0_g1_i5.p1 TRINITY_DN1655_c0_g1~~TRINITY_DN1655_c0_g1_i5.p1  ORF type:complete len:111 (-),score=17.28 TRINITY_DN1655_c0_g1_i5:26-358(-)